MPPEEPFPLTPDEELAADRLLVELLAERLNTVDLGAGTAARDDAPAHELRPPAAAAG
ncbi:hypothetical protein GKE82_19635 [Conexibacter sp. W3-3-2]|uniref:hypothetical protein n=1 Tax=Solirubrobacterales TaxID=588673 RepID=UPI0012B9CD1E|nr:MULTISPECIES: hypothetical protein [Solirubrobacterales]MTD46437.1 hypothetical protein [Conexibacter sp. W3-3-2]